MYGPRKLAIGMMCALAFGGCVKKVTPPPPTVSTGTTSTPTGGSTQQETRTTAIVDKVDRANRLVTLRTSDGNKVTVRAGDEVRNLKQLHRGDRVVVVSYEAIAFQVLQPGEAQPAAWSDEDVFVAPLGQKPAGAAVRETTLIAKIVKLDRAHQQAMLRGPKGKVVAVKVENPENFDKVKVGDMVAVTYTEAFGIEVQSPSKKH